MMKLKQKNLEKQMKIEKNKWLLIFIIYSILLVALTIYSYSQIDLNLTLSSNRFYQSIQQSLIQLGYYNRPISATLFLIFIASLFGLYFWMLMLVRKQQLTLKLIWWLIGLTTILVIAYPAFSHDLFNYMFDARIATKYALPPQLFKALDFPADSWVRFMRWTHRYYPYGTGWLLLTLIPSFIGMGKFVMTLLLFKIVFLIFHLLNCRFIQKILEKTAPDKVKFGVVFFAFNPLVIIESILSPHNEVVMLTFALLGFYLLITKKNSSAILSLIISLSVKFVSVVLLPLTIFWKGKYIDSFFKRAFYLWLIALVPLVQSRELLSWYFVPLVGLAGLINKSLIEKSLIIGISGATLVRYFPFLLFGEYNARTSYYEQSGMILAFTIFTLLSLVLWRKKSHASS